MKITEVNIQFIKPNNGLIGFASVVIESQMFLGSIGIHKKLSSDGYRLTYPTKKLGEQSSHVFHPIRREMSDAIETAVFSKLKNVMNKVNHHDQG